MEILKIRTVLLGINKIVGLLAVLQASYLLGALLRVSGRGAPQRRRLPLRFSAVPRADGR
jgi:hypothetical protein